MKMRKLVVSCVLPLAFCAAAVSFIGCASSSGVTAGAEAVQPAEPVTAAVSSINKYGNCSLSLTAETLAANGIEAGDLLSVQAGGYTGTVPYGTNYSDVEHGKVLVVNYKGDIQIAVNMGNFAKLSGASEGSEVTLTLAEKAGYLKEYKIRQLKKSEKREDYASDAVYANFRAVQAGRIARNRLYRGCNPVEGDARSPYSDALAKEAGVQVVMNLADTAEAAAGHYDVAPYYASLIEKGNVIFLNMGVSFSDPDFIAKLHDGLVFISEHKNGPYMVHCKEGKDRAGFVNALLEALCGATLEEMTEDYMLSFENYFGVQKGTEQYTLIGQTIPDMFKAMNDGKKVTNKNVQAVAKNYALKTVGLTKEQLAALIEVLEK